MSWGTVTESLDAVDGHHYSTHEPDDLSAWLEALAAEYVELRVACRTPLPDFLELSGLGSFSGAAIKARLMKSTVPMPDFDKGNFSVLRADLSEVAAYMLLERSFGTEIAFKLVRDRELIQLPGRGIDAIGIEVQDKHIIVLTEVKFSDEKPKPGKPLQIVDASKDCMRKQHIGHLEDREGTINKLLDCARRATTDAERDNLLAAALYLEKQVWSKVGVVSCCVLVRPKDRFTDNDFGSFKASPKDYDPARVRFLVWKLPGDMNTILKSWGEAVEAKRQAK